MLLDPWWVLRSAAVPYWMTFNTEAAADGLGRYLAEAKPYDEIALTLVSNGLRTVGLASIERWRALLARARRNGRFAGVDPDRFPSDLAVFARYQDVLRASPHVPMPEPLTLADVDAFHAERGDPYPVAWS